MSKENRSLPLDEWPEADRTAWLDACRPSVRLLRGGALSHLNDISRTDYANRYRSLHGVPAAHKNGFGWTCRLLARVTCENVDAYLANLRSRVTSVSQYNFISKLRRAAMALAPAIDFGWLYQLECDLKFVAQPSASSTGWSQATVWSRLGSP